MSAKAGIRKHGQRAIDALFTEFAQLHNKTVFDAVHASDLTPEQKKAALRAINVLKEKRDGALKGRSCADGRCQRGLYAKHETSSPTLSNDALMLSLVVDAKEGRDVAMADVVGAYLNANMDAFVVMKLEGEAVDIMCRVDSLYEKYVVIEFGKRVLYLRLAKALYGCVRSALLWYDLFVSTLKEMGFTLNPYDSCVANCTIDGSQCTIVWYVDNTKVSHRDATVVSEIIKKIESKFGSMTVSRGLRHEFLGMEIIFNGDGTVSITMKEYLREAMDDFGEDLSRGATSPGNKNLYVVKPHSPPLTAEKRKVFHGIVAKLLYVSSRARTDLQPTIPFLLTRVEDSSTDDWDKLRRLMRYIYGTVDMPLILGAENFPTLHTWVDALYAVHSNMRSHTGRSFLWDAEVLFANPLARN